MAGDCHPPEFQDEIATSVVAQSPRRELVLAGRFTTRPTKTTSMKGETKMARSITKVFRDEDELRRWYAVFCNGDDATRYRPETWVGPQSILRGFMLDDDADLYGEREDVSEIPHTTCFDCGYMASTGKWDESLENLLTEFRNEGDIEITIYYEEPLVDPVDWEWLYENPSEYVKERMADYNNRREELDDTPSTEDIIMDYYEPSLDAFLRADDSEYDVDTKLGEEAKEFISKLTSEDEEKFIGLIWRDIIASELSDVWEVEVEKSYLRAKGKFEKLVSADDGRIFKVPFENLSTLKTRHEGSPE